MPNPARTPDAPGSALSADDLAVIAAEVLSASSYPALVLDVPSQRIVAAGPQASKLLDPSGTSVVGQLLEEYTADRPLVGADLFAGGRLNGFETFRVLRRTRGAGLRVRMWVRTFEHQPPSRLVLLILVPDEGGRAKAPPAEEDTAAPTPAIVGTADAQLRIERISSDAEQLFNTSVDELLGQPLAGLVHESDVPALDAAFETASAGITGVTTTVHIDVRDDAEGLRPVTCELLLLPLQPAPSCAFVLLPTQSGLSPDPMNPESLPAILARLGKGAELAHHVRGVLSGLTNHDVPGINKLTTRELEIVGRLLDGDRAPAIAARLFLTQSTVRNHLASVFAKLGVNSQQQLLDLFRS